MFVQKLKKKCINPKMFNNLFKFISILVISFFNINNLAYSEIVNKIEISGNERIADETIKMILCYRNLSFRRTFVLSHFFID